MINDRLMVLDTFCEVYDLQYNRNRYFEFAQEQKYKMENLFK